MRKENFAAILIFIGLFSVVFSRVDAQHKIDSTKIEVVKWEGSEYAFVRHIKPNQKEAVCECDKLNMKLVKIETAAENIFLKQEAFKKNGVKVKDINQYWIGASDLNKEGKWLWLSDSSKFYNQKKHKPINSSYTNWGKTKKGKQPNNVLKNEEYENCAVLRQNGFWFDIGCHRRYAHVICERIIK